jgi:phospholipid/cholesterol/gamma-HCH transport system substrate-binding protein
MDLHYKQEVTVGVLVIVGIGLFLGGTMWLKGTSFKRGQAEVRVAFPTVGTLKRGSAVRVSGVHMGGVDRIDFESVGRVVVTLLVDPRVAPRIDASATLTTVGLVADAIVKFHPGTSTQPLPDDAVIQGVVDQGLTELGTELGGKAREALASFNELANKELADNLNATLTAMQRLMAFYGNSRQGPASELTRTMQQLQTLSARLDSTLARTDLASTLRKSDTLVTNLSATSAEFTLTASRLDSVVQKINSGEGSLGKLVTDTLLYSDLRRLVGSIKELADELRRHPGKITIQVRPF